MRLFWGTRWQQIYREAPCVAAWTSDVTIRGSWITPETCLQTGVYFHLWPHSFHIEIRTQFLLRTWQQCTVLASMESSCHCTFIWYHCVQWNHWIYQQGPVFIRQGPSLGLREGLILVVFDQTRGLSIVDSLASQLQLILFWLPLCCVLASMTTQQKIVTTTIKSSLFLLITHHMHSPCWKYCRFPNTCKQTFCAYIATLSTVSISSTLLARSSKAKG